MVLGCILCQQPLVTRIQPKLKKKQIYSKVARSSKKLQSLKQQALGPIAAAANSSTKSQPKKSSLSNKNQVVSIPAAAAAAAAANSSSKPPWDNTISNQAPAAPSSGRCFSPSQLFVQHPFHIQPTEIGSIDDKTLFGQYALEYIEQNGTDYQIVATKCGHLFHRGCLKTYVSYKPDMTIGNKRECPFCSKPITLNQCIPTELLVPDEHLILDHNTTLLAENDMLQKHLVHLRDAFIPERKGYLNELKKEAEHKKKELCEKLDHLEHLKAKLCSKQFDTLRFELDQVEARNEQLLNQNNELVALIQNAVKITNDADKASNISNPLSKSSSIIAFPIPDPAKVEVKIKPADKKTDNNEDVPGRQYRPLVLMPQLCTPKIRQGPSNVEDFKMENRKLKYEPITSEETEEGSNYDADDDEDDHEDEEKYLQAFKNRTGRINNAAAKIKTLVPPAADNEKDNDSSNSSTYLQYSSANSSAKSPPRKLTSIELKTKPNTYKFFN